ncbi:4-hydroxybenzoate transporter PcaK [Corynebacterium occultum]|uniref:4-hydroxybenzoate transporter PcaK n=1 Tax=Corynebacterium occultum TaxID=2675219 RepID=A0A6B8W603_9CORY|nr:MFS transporter [Corynebacterium occultum]QGU08011.1 4-hydroxybenzoate transporter PcaK [Corynebacterium occultum]
MSTDNPALWRTVLICGAAVAFDGYDLVAYGTTLSELRAEWGISATQAGLLGSAPLIGMLLGSISAGALTSRWSRNTVLAACVTWFSIFMAACALAPGPGWFLALRFLSGLGLGATLPIAAAITQQAAPAGRRNLVYVIMQSGFPLGGVAAALAGMVLIPNFSWHAVYLMGALPLITILPAILFWLPREKSTPTELGGAMQALAPLFAPGWRVVTLLFWALAFCAMLFVYGANTWLPALMRENGHGVTSSLVFLLTFNLGAIVGGVLAGWLADRFGSRPVVAASFLLGAVAVGAFAFLRGESTLLLCAALAGYGAVGTQTLINSWATAAYPEAARVAGVGWALGAGRLGGILGPTLTGMVIALGFTQTGPFLLFCVVAVVGAVLASGLRPPKQPAAVGSSPVVGIPVPAAH